MAVAIANRLSWDERVAGPVLCRPRFWNRGDAGCRLAARLAGHGRRSDSLVLALPRGGVPVGYQVAEFLGLPLDVFLVRKLGVPGRSELAFGAISSGGVRVLNPELIKRLRLADHVVERITTEQRMVLRRQESAYRGDRPAPAVSGRHVILVDDGLATGASMRAALVALRRRHPASIVVAVPIADPRVCAELEGADEVVWACAPENFGAVSRWYQDFSATTDEEVKDLLARAPAS
ncbi:MAG: phosphoribosyltransferase [Acidimicrobiales bacterium]